MHKILKLLLILLVLAIAACGVVLYRPDLDPAELEELYAGGASRFLEWDGLRIHYRDEGAGPPLLLIHGTAASLHTWDAWVAELGERYRLVRLDLPGFGLTGPEPDHDYSIERRVDVLVALLDHLGIERATVAGNSLGGYVAWQLAWRRPERVDALVLVDASGYPKGPSSGGNIFDLGRVPVLGPLLSKLTPRALVAAGVRQAYGDPSVPSPELIDRYYRLLRRAGNRQALLVALNRERRDDTARIPGITQPTLVMWGEEDQLVPVADAERFHEDLPKSQLVVYPEIGHLPMEETPERSARDATAFLEGLL